MVAASGDNLYAIVTQVSAFLTAARTQAASGMTWQKFGQLLLDLLHQAVTALDAVSGLTGPEKKTLVLTAVASLFDSVADRCVPLTLYPFWSIIRPATRTLVLAIASGAIESLLPITRSA
jgi:hypothetical protein